MKISGKLLSSKPYSLSRAAKLITRFAAVDNGSSATVSLYLQRTADAFNYLVQFHNKRPKNSDVEKNSPDREKARKSETDRLEKNPEENSAKNREKRDKKTVNEAAEANPNEDEVKDLKSEEKEERKEEKKKKKKRKSDGDDSKEKSKKQKENS